MYCAHVIEGQRAGEWLNFKTMSGLCRQIGAADYKINESDGPFSDVQHVTFVGPYSWKADGWPVRGVALVPQTALYGETRMYVISDAQAATIAPQWCDLKNESSALHVLASSGAIVDGVQDEIRQALERLPYGKARMPLVALDKYVVNRDDHGPIAGWGELIDETAVTLDQC